VVFLGEYINGKPFFEATAFLIKVENVQFLVTAKHVIVNRQNDTRKKIELLAFFNSKDGNLLNRSINDIRNELKVDWIFHKDKNVDIGIIPFPADLNTDDLLFITEEIFLYSEKLSEIMNVFFVSHQPQILGVNRINPIVRGGMISLVNDDRSFYVDATTFPGNSGSPVFFNPPPIIEGPGDRLRELANTYGRIKLIGVVSEYIPYEDVAISENTGQRRVLFQENTGLSRIWSSSHIDEIIRSKPFKKQLVRLRMSNHSDSVDYS
jgi:hypothetical protein